MKKTPTVIIALIAISVILSVSCVTKAADVQKKRVSAIYTKEDAQVYTEEGKEKEELDTIWIYFSDGTFEQYAAFDDALTLFSSGSYEIAGNDITIRRNRKYQNGVLSDYASVHTYSLGTLGYEKIYDSNEKGKKIEAVFFGREKQLLTLPDGEKEMLDTIWMYYDDMTFEQYAVVEGRMVLFSNGDYSFADGGDFVYEASKEKEADITINRHQKYSSLSSGLTEHESSHTYDLSTLGFLEIVEPVL